jgi:uncharacterized repeat protein (TIGR01451 family)/LPXTG-motif cell wall-anchored protein
VNPATLYGVRGGVVRRTLLIALIVLMVLSVVVIISGPAQATEPGIAVNKTTNGVDSDAPPGIPVRVGDPVVWDYTIANVGDTPVTDVVLTDTGVNKPTVVVDCPGAADGLDVGETATCTASGVSYWSTTMPTFEGVRYYQNLAEGVGYVPLKEVTVTDRDYDHYTPVLYCPIPTAPGDVRYDLINLGDNGYLASGGDTLGPVGFSLDAGYYDVKLASYDAHSQVSGSDQPNERYRVDVLAGGSVVASSAAISDLPASRDFLVETVNSASISAGTIHVTSAIDSLRAVHTASSGDFNDHNALCVVFTPATPPPPGLSITKTSTSHPDGNGDGTADAPAKPGDTIDYSITTTNTGEVALTGVTVTDSLLADLTCTWPGTPGTLAVGASVTCTGSHKLTQAEVDAGKVDNTATATSNETGPKTDTYQVPVTQSPAIDIVKGPKGTVAVPKGTDHTWTITVTNTGDVTLTDVTVTDVVSPSCDSVLGTMAPGASEAYECALAIEKDTLNTAVVVGTSPKSEKVTDEDTATVGVVAASGTIGDTVWHDKNKNGKQDSGEPGIAGAKVQLTNLDTGAVSTQTTNSNGLYLFSALEAGNYTSALVKSSVSGELTTPGSFTIALADGQSFLDADFGLADALPATGLDTAQSAALGIGLLLLGAVLLLATRRRRDDIV